RVDHTGVLDGGAFHRVPVDQAVPPPRRELLVSPVLRSVTTSVEGNLHLGGGVSREGLHFLRDSGAGLSVNVYRRCDIGQVRVYVVIVPVAVPADVKKHRDTL